MQAAMDERKEEQGMKKKMKMEEKTMVYVCLAVEFNEYMPRPVWYKFNPLALHTAKYNVEDLDPIKLPEPIRERADFHVPTTSACCGSKLYMFGGNVFPPLKLSDGTIVPDKDVGKASDRIIVCDTSKGDMIWKKHPKRMIIPRYAPQALTLYDKIYIFGGVGPSLSRKPYAEVFAEVFNTNSGVCSSMKASPFPLFPHKPVALHGNKFLFANHVTYDPLTEIWDATPDPPPYPLATYAFTSAAVDHVLYTYSNLAVYAYDLLFKDWFRTRPQRLDLFKCSLDPSNKGFVIHLGNQKLCVGGITSCNTPKASQLHCLTFQPCIKQQANGPRRIEAKVDSYVRYRTVDAIGLFGAHLVDDGSR